MLLEREASIEELAAAWEAAAAGEGRIVAIAGEAGIGKTSLVRALLERVGDEAVVLQGGCEALHTPRPLGPLHDMAAAADASWTRQLVADGSRAALFSAFIEDLRTSRRPRLVVFEDVHWADEATLDLLKVLGRRIGRTHALLLVTYRDDELTAAHPLRAVLGEWPRPALHRITLTGLSPQAIAVLAGTKGPEAAGLHAATCGNPFFVTEVLASGDPGVPATVRDAVLARTSRLPEGARAVIDLVSTVPTRAERALIEAVLHPHPADLDACTGAGVLREDRHGLAFRHEIARRAVLDSLGESRRRRLHGLVLGALMEDPQAPVSRLAHHAEEAGDGEAVLRFAPAAALEAASLGSHREAAAHYRNAFELARNGSPESYVDLAEKLSYECYLTGQLLEAIEARHHALDGLRALGRGEAEGRQLRWLSRLSWFVGRKEDADRYARESVDLLERIPPGVELAWAYSNVAQLHCLADETAPAVEWGGRAIELAERIGADEVTIHALNNVGSARMLGDADPELGRRELERSLDLALGADLQEHVARAYTNLGSGLVRSREYAPARDALDRGILYARERDLDSWSLYMLGWRATLHLDEGRWDQAAADATAVLDGSSRAAVIRLPALVPLALVRARRGDPGVAELLDEARDLAVGTGEAQRILPVAAARAEAAWLRDDLAACRAEAAWGLEHAVEGAGPWTLGEIGHWLFLTGAEVDRSQPWATPYAALADGDWRRAAAAWGELHCVYEQAAALAEGDAEARIEALRRFDALGAVAAADRLRRRMKSDGVGRVPRGRRPSTRANPAGLTARQMEILPLLCEGLGNAEIARRLFISPKTAEHHVSAILARLEVEGRGEVPARARSLGVWPPPN